MVSSKIQIPLDIPVELVLVAVESVHMTVRTRTVYLEDVRLDTSTAVTQYAQLVLSTAATVRRPRRAYRNSVQPAMELTDRLVTCSVTRVEADVSLAPLMPRTTQRVSNVPLSMYSAVEPVLLVLPTASAVDTIASTVDQYVLMEIVLLSMRRVQMGRANLVRLTVLLARTIQPI